MDSHEVRREWAERSGEYSPDYYAYYGPDETSESVRSIADRLTGPDPAILELGCSSGRHLAHLLEHGYRDLTGIELNGDAFDVMADAYPDLAADGTFYHDSIEAVVEAVPDDRFDLVYSVETLQHLHPDATWVFDELARITCGHLVTIENEGDDQESPPGDADPVEGVSYVNDEFPLYYRDWDRIFTERGLESVPVTDDERSVVHGVDTVRAFRSVATVEE
ncbi:Methyltransferase type 11 [Salinarchaeum sp. Harcht-Bsk1]|uniref:class I SAM-dependent methyltransferase n=1 Tax=Salinarchaeum sp. Harcht-Bsk1 TaxID=1333523 RepID=UPI00034233AF|nr:class I SAM-dependent methyltransferase [Salinarchaeum sp. Harcht-Bsk1]AGN00352.1 Methyltransferase type 11 [Salinarchaeum sp. Harcht-Bsk1]